MFFLGDGGDADENDDNNTIIYIYTIYIDYDIIMVVIINNYNSDCNEAT